MEREEFKILVKGMKAVYADPKFIPDKDAFEVWYSLLKDLEYGTANIAVQKYMMSSKFPPTIADIREQYASITQTQELNEMEAWSLVSKALRNGYYGAEKEFARIPPVVQKAVGAPSQLRNWAMTDSESVENVIQSNFMRTYRSVLEREKEIAKMPTRIRELIGGAGQEARKALEGAAVIYQ